MDKIKFEERDGRYFIKSGPTIDWEVHEDDWRHIKAKINQIAEGRPHWDQFPKSKIEYKDDFDLMKQCVHQIEFFNGYYVTRDESSEIHKLILRAHDNFHGGQLAIFGSFPGMKVAGLMKDSGIHQITIY